jgi:hypothetical protein
MLLQRAEQDIQQDYDLSFCAVSKNIPTLPAPSLHMYMLSQNNPDRQYNKFKCKIHTSRKNGWRFFSFFLDPMKKR